jgi:hypothetical protein
MNKISLYFFVHQVLGYTPSLVVETSVNYLLPNCPFDNFNSTEKLHSIQIYPFLLLFSGIHTISILIRLANIFTGEYWPQGTAVVVH